MTPVDDTTRSPDADDGIARLTILYVAALAAVACLSITGQAIVQARLSRQSGDSTVVNVAGRQRMLSQRLCKCVLALRSEDRDGRADSARELADLLPTWRRCHAGLQRGDVELGLPGDNGPAIAAIYARITPDFERMSAAAERIIGRPAASPAPSEEDVAGVLAGEAEFLHGMDEIVSGYEDEARERVARLRKIETWLLALTLAVLAAEGLFVFRPAVRHIRSAFAALRRTRDALRVAKEAAETANAAKSRFLANVSHELRTPLHAALGAIELLGRTRLNERQTDYARIIDDSGRGLLHLLNDLLDLARIEAGRLEVSPTPCRLRDLVERTASLVGVEAERKGLTLTVAIAPDVPDGVVLDEGRVRQVLVNLLDNAVKFTVHGSVRLAVTAESTPPGSTHLRFAVTDTGIGIAAPDQNRIFESFSQVDASSARRQAGVGLGLAICARLVDLMGGRIELHSVPGSGSTFRFDLPCATGDGRRAATGGEVPSSAPPLGRPLRILAADDAPLGRRVLEELLQGAGHVVTAVADGRAVIEACGAGVFDLVLLDVQMPVLDGVSAARTIRTAERERGGPQTPIVALSADALPEERARCLAAGIDEYLVKPISGAALAEAIARLVGRDLPTPGPAAANAVGPAAGDADLVGLAAAERSLRGNRPLALELAELFLSETEGLLAGIDAALSTGDGRRAFVLVHRLKGQLAFFGEQRAEEEAAAIEGAAADDDCAAARRRYPGLVRHTRDLASRLKGEAAAALSA